MFPRFQFGMVFMTEVKIVVSVQLYNVSFGFSLKHVFWFRPEIVLFSWFSYEIVPTWRVYQEFWWRQPTACQNKFI